ncbi:MAG: methyltransferase domain-containing protein, partial [Erysipelotrichaceae bacterium]|nr:methyltransferase domain-containing protein [Erysipelotrichaceae bacterium]
MKRADYLKGIGYEFLQDDSLYKINTDTVSLGMFLDPMIRKTVLDIGTNTGALLLYALHQGADRLIGVDIHEDALQIASENLKRYTDNYQLICQRIQEVRIDPVDAIVCNPPFFEMNNVTEDGYFKEAMFEESLPPEELFLSFRRLLKDNGEIYLIYQADRFPELYELCLKYRLKIMKMQYVHD